MEINKLEQIFTSKFNAENWKEIISNLFSNAEIYKTPIESIDKTTKYHEVAKSIKEFGSARLADNKNIKFYDVELEDDKYVTKNRVGLRNLIHREVIPGDIDAIFAVYHTKGHSDWRLTFISKSIFWDDDFNENKDETHPKRYTYVLGEDESVKTALNQFEELFDKQLTIKHLIEAFSVEKLNKEFFKKYKLHYNKFWKFIESKEEYANLFVSTLNEKKGKAIRDFVKKLLGRLVFLHFLQKKGWMGCPTEIQKWGNGEKQFMLKLLQEFQDKPHFHSKCLTTLFFKTLNEKRDEDVFLVEGLSAELNNTRVPYLNGGLFESDTPKSASKIDFPIAYFEELFEFFSQYNFTIDENSPDDHEVGIDPEMLGHIFENLLEENKEKGAFYTPKEIVQYMTQESLIQYLQAYLGERTEIQQFIRFGEKGNEHSKHNFIRENAKEIEKLLDKVKICDPAIGSGAFPMGMLHEIFKAKMALDWTLDPAVVKKNIIQNSIYGVDLESGAVDIARLRFWLALVVDEDKPQPLPNLDYKIMQGNSLLESFEGIDLSEIHEGKSFDIEVKNDQVNLFSGQVQKKISQSLNFERIEDLINEYFDLDDSEEKKEVHQKIDKHVLDHIHFTLEDHKADLHELTKKLQRKIKDKSASLSNGEQKVKFENESKDAKTLKKLNNELDHITDKEIKLNQLSHSNDRPFFLWHLFFKEVFDQGGFDIVIGNPPYVRQELIKDVKPTLKENYKVFNSTSDLYTYFYELTYNLIKENGISCFITNNGWIRSKYGKKLRDFFLKNTVIKEIINFEDEQKFQTAIVESNILFFSKLKPKTNDRVRYGQSILSDKPFFYIEQSYLDKDGFILENPQTLKIKKQIEEIGKPLKECNVKINYGIKSGYNEAFYISEDYKDTLIFQNERNKDIIKPLLRGRDIAKYELKNGGVWFLFIPWHFPLHDDKKITGASKEAEDEFKKDYPEIYSHLDTYFDKLNARNKAETGIRYEWYALQRCAATYKEDFKKEKIVWLTISDKPKFALDQHGHYMNDSTFMMTGSNLKFFLAILNSKICEWYFNLIAPSSGMGTTMWKKAYMENIPIAQVSEKNKIAIDLLVNMVLFFKNKTNILVSNNSNVSSNLIVNFIENVIDAIVFELYFQKHMEDRELNVLHFVISDLEKVFGNKLFEDLSVGDKSIKTLELYKDWIHPDNPIRNRMKLFAVKSPEILMPIIESTQ